MPAKIAKSAARPPFGLPEMLVAVHTSRLSCREPEKAPIFTPVQESSGESKFEASIAPRSRHADRPVIPGDNALDAGSVSRHGDEHPRRNNGLRLSFYAQVRRNGAVGNAVV